MTNRVLRYRNRVALVAGVVAPVAVDAVLAPFRGSFANTAAVLTVVVVIVVVAVMGTRIAGVVASASGALWFDFFLTRPYDRFTISHRPDLETTIALFAVGVLVTEVAARGRAHWRAASNSTAYVAMLHGVAVLAADSAPVTEMIDHTNDSLVRLLSLRGCRFDKSLSEPPLAQIQSNGEVVHVGIKWPAREIGLPGPESEIVATWRGRAVGRFVLTPTPGATVTLEQRIVAVALVDVFAAYLAGERHAM